MISTARQVAVIGGGWAGCAAAVELAARGARVALFESARTLGGRARRVDIENLGLDNGQHILIGAYTETLRVMRLAGVEVDAALLHLPLQMRYPRDSGCMDFVAARLPAPLHMLLALLRASGLSRDDKLALARFSTTARWMGWRLHRDCSVSELLARFDQTERLTKLMWRPLCIAALNTPPERASAQVFLNVLRDSLGASRRASDMLLPRTDLSALFPRQAAAFVERHGGVVATGKAVRRIAKDGARWRLSFGARDDDDLFDAVVVATPPDRAAALLDGVIDVAGLKSFTHEPITTCYLQYETSLRLPGPFFALLDEPARQAWGQFVFDRGALDVAHAGLLAVVVSASTEAIEAGHEAMSAAIAQQLAEAFRRPELARPLWTKVISEKRATFSCVPDLARPSNATGVDGLFIAGDYTAGDYPATLEAAVRSGVTAGRLAA
ncbi:MAG TPA: hydroxysqualene dehydroxylase HpnE [Paucimonas sp.]|nr:hydroxysqualene dehydroxylase HpnE [Paucimonas sp.]